VEISLQEYKRVAVFTVTGRIDSATAAELETSIQSAIDKGHKHLILDLSAVDFLSSSGLRVMVNTLKTLRKVGGELCVAQPSERVASSLSIAGLDALFHSFESREAAIASF
jgi:anti-anti-sigma factor